MDKEQAIDLLDNLIGMVEDNQENDYDTAFRMAIDALKAQLLQKDTTKDATSDTISRQAAIDIFDDYNVSVENGELEAYSRDRKRLCELPTIQPHLIAKIQNGIKATNTNDVYSCGMRNGMRWCISLIDDKEPLYENCPPAQPESQEGEWVQIQRCAGDAQPDLECPFCKYRIGWWDMGRYCAGCGAKLEGGAG